MPAYWLARVEVVDPVQYKIYTDQVPAILAKWKAKIRARGGRFALLECNDKIKWAADFNRFIVIEFETMADAVGCYNSPEYQAAMAARKDGAGINELIIVDGGDATD